MSRRKSLKDIKTMNALFTAAEEEAAAVGETEAGTEHLILAAFELPDGSAVRAFKRVGVYPKAFRKAIQDQHDEALRAIGIAPDAAKLDDRLPDPVPPSSPLQTTGPAQTVFKKVVKMVKKERSQLYGAYIVLAATEANQGTTARTLDRLGVRREALAAAAREELDALNT